MPWIILTVAGLLEVFWALMMKQSDGFTRFWPSIAALVGMAASVGLLAIAMRSLPLGTAYVIWTGIGAVGAFVAGIILLGEAVNLPRIIAAVLIVSGMIVMKLASPE